MDSDGERSAGRGADVTGVVAETLPNRGLDPADNVHMVPRAVLDYTQHEAFTWGHPVQDLTLLMVLDAVRQALEVGE